MLPSILLQAACIACICIHVGLAALLASSTIEKCVRSGVGDTIDESCQEKIFTSLTMEGGQSIVTEELQYTISCISDDGVCPCQCNYAADEGCTCRDLNGTVTVGVTKSPVMLMYPLTYMRNVNYYATEEVIYTYNCEDGALAEIPTCSWLSIDNQIQDDSQGFCCECSSGSIYDSTFGDDTQRSRSGLNCNWFEQPFIPFFSSMPQSAHCMRVNNPWWEMYRIHEARVIFEITITVNSSLASNVAEVDAAPNSTISTLTLSPSLPRAVTEDKRVSAHLLGELAPYIQFPVLTSSKFLMAKSIASLTSINPREMMIIPDNIVTEDGSQCNKIGVGFSAFRYQNQGCSRKIASCLDNQPYHLVTEDDDRVANGLEPLHRAQRYAQAGRPSLWMNTSLPFGQRTLELQFPVASISSSLLTLEVAADSLKFVQNYSPGQILSAKFCNSARTVCNSVAALNSAAMAMIDVKNIGTLPASYITSLHSCTYPITPVPAQSLSLGPKESTEVWFEVYMASSDAAEQANCTIDLFDSQGQVTDTAVLSFAVNATVFESLPDPMAPPAVRTTESFSPPAVVGCIEKVVKWSPSYGDIMASGIIGSCLCCPNCNKRHPCDRPCPALDESGLLSSLLGGGSAPKRYHSRSVHHGYRERPRKPRSYPSSSAQDSDDEDARSLSKHGKQASSRHCRDNSQDRRHGGQSKSHKESCPRSKHGSDAPTRKPKSLDPGNRPSSARGKPSTKAHMSRQLQKPAHTRSRSQIRSSPSRRQHASESGTSSSGVSRISDSSSDGSSELHTRAQPLKSQHVTGTSRSKEQKSKGGRSKKQQEAKGDHGVKRTQQQQKTRSRSGHKSRSGHAVAEGLNQSSRPVDADWENGKYHSKVPLNKTFISTSSEGNVDAEHPSVTGEYDEIAGSCAGKTHCSGIEPQDDEVEALSVVIHPCASLK